MDRLRRWPRAFASQAARLAAALTLVYALIVALAWWGQEHLIFRPLKLADDHVFRVPADVHERWFDVEGGRLHALHLKLPQPAGIVYYLHGNGGSLDQWWVNPVFWRELNFDLVMIDYRGYGKSPGRIESEEQLHTDVRAVWAQLAPAYVGRRVVFFGRSLGTGLAVQLAAALPEPAQPDLLVVVAPYESLLRLKREHYALLPDAALRYPLRSDLALPRVSSPVLMFHGRQDRLITPAHSEALLALARRGRRVLIDEAGHHDVQRFESYRVALRDALRKLTGAPR